MELELSLYNSGSDTRATHLVSQSTGWPTPQEGSTQAVPGPQELCPSANPGESVSYHCFCLPTQVTLLRSPAPPCLKLTATPWGPGEPVSPGSLPFRPEDLCPSALCLVDARPGSSHFRNPTCKNKSLGSPYFLMALRTSMGWFHPYCHLSA